MKMRVFAFAFVAAALSQTAGAITATKEYVDRKDAVIVSNTYTKAETEARIAELAPGDYAAVSNAAMNAAMNATNLVAAATNDIPRITESQDYPGVAEMSVHAFFAGRAEESDFAERTENANLADALRGPNGNRTSGSILSQLDAATETNAAQSASIAAIPATVSNTVTKAYVEGLGINVGISAETATNIAEVVAQTSLGSATNYTDALEAKITSGAIRADEANWAAWANNAGNADIAGSSDTASALNGDGGQSRSADQIFAQLDSAATPDGVTNIITNVVTKAYVERLGIDAGISGIGVTNIVTNVVTKAYVEGLGIEAGISADTATNIAETAAAEATEGLLSSESDPVWSSEKSGYATTDAVSNVSESVGMLWSYVNRDNVWIAVTNYMRSVVGVSPSLQLWEVRDGETNMVYWSKEEITNVTHDLIHDCKTNLEATVRSAVAEMPDKAWSKYQSATGNEAPDGVTIVSTPTIQLTGGGEWYRYVDVASNSVWFLKSNGLYTFGGDTNGYFRILDDEGNATFEVRKTNSYLVEAVPSSVHFDADGNFCVSFQANLQPVIYTTATLDNPNFLPEGEDPNVTVTWTQSGGVYTATLEQAVKGPSLFAYAKVEVQGETVIRNTAPTDVSGGILCTDGVHKCRPVYSNGSITWEVVQ